MSHDDKHPHGYDPYDRPNGYEPYEEIEFMLPYFNNGTWTGGLSHLPYVAVPFKKDVMDNDYGRGDEDLSDHYSY
jgi:hypothetical protein